MDEIQTVNITWWQRDVRTIVGIMFDYPNLPPCFVRDRGKQWSAAYSDYVIGYFDSRLEAQTYCEEMVLKDLNS